MTFLDCNKYTVKAVLDDVSSAVQSLFTLCTDPDEDFEITKDGESSKKVNTAKRGLFASSFEAIPCNLTIEPLQFRTGRRYIQPDAFPDDEDLDDYLFLSKTSGLVSAASDLSFHLATNSELEFQQMCRDFAEEFQKLPQEHVGAFQEKYPQLIEFLTEQISTVNGEIFESYFSYPDGQADADSLQEVWKFLKNLVAIGGLTLPKLGPFDEGEEEDEELFSSLDSDTPLPHCFFSNEISY